MAGAYLVVRIKGQADVPHWAATTMRLLCLEKKYRATIVPARENTLGMLDKVKHYVSWHEADPELTRELLLEKGRGRGYRKLSEADLEGREDYRSVGELANALSGGRVSLSGLRPLVKPWFALSPPRRGFGRSTKRLYGQKGVLGANRDLPGLVRRMMG